MERRLQVLFDLRRIAVELERLDVALSFTTESRELDRLAAERDFLVDAKRNLEDEHSEITVGRLE